MLRGINYKVLLKLDFFTTRRMISFAVFVPSMIISFPLFTLITDITTHYLNSASTRIHSIKNDLLYEEQHEVKVTNKFTTGHRVSVITKKFYF